MPEDSNSGPVPALGPSTRVPPMTLWEKLAFWAVPSWLAVCGTELLAVAIFCLGKIGIVLLFNFHKYLHHPDRLQVLGHMLTVAAIIAAVTVALSGVFLVYPAFVWRKMFRRRKETGSLLPQGEELAMRRWKKKNPSLLVRLSMIGFFTLIALGVTHSLMISPHRHVLINWGYPVLLWLIAAIVAIESLFPAPDRAWTGFTGAAAFGLLAILGVTGTVHARAWGIMNWLFPLLMASFCAGLTVQSIRALRRRRATLDAAAEELT
jgi:hypothetical protein